jgi:ferredoxin
VVDIHLAAAADFHVLDAVDVIDGDGSRKGSIRNMGALAAGKNAFALESLALELAGLDPSDSMPLAAAVRRGVCGRGVGWFEVLGESVASLRSPGFRLPSENLFSEHRLAAISGRFSRFFAVTPYPLPGACTRCGKCVEVCPRGAITLGKEAAEVDPRKCIRCFCCDELCEFKAIALRRPLLGRIFRPQD